MNKLILSGLCLIALISSCSTPTKITARWKEPGATGAPYKHVFVAALTEKTSAKQAFEQEMAGQLKTNGIESTRSADAYPYKFTQENKPSKEELIAKIRENGSDGILTFSLVKQKEEVRYVPGNNNAYAPHGGPYSYYGNFGGYYGYYGYRSYDPGYYTEDDVYFIESNFYDSKTEKLIWSAQSKTYNPEDAEQFAKDFARVITRQLIKDALIVPVPKP